MDLTKLLVFVIILYALFSSGILENFWGWGRRYPNYGYGYGGMRYPSHRRRYHGYGYGRYGGIRGRPFRHGYGRWY